MSCYLVACEQAFDRAGWGEGKASFPFLAIFFPKQRACSQASYLAIFWPYFSLPGRISFEVRSPQSTFYRFFIPSPCFVPSPYFPVRVFYLIHIFYAQSLVRSPQSMFYTDRWKKSKWHKTWFRLLSRFRNYLWAQRKPNPGTKRYSSIKHFRIAWLFLIDIL